MSVINLTFSKNGTFFETEPLRSPGGDIRVRVHKNGPYPVELLVSIDGELEYLRYDDFGFEERSCEITLEGVMPGQYIRFRSRSELTLVRCLTI